MTAKSQTKKMYISVIPGEQVEVGVTEDSKIQEFYVEMLHQVKMRGNIYKATIHNIDNSLQAAFVNYGAVKNGFLQIDEVHPEYYLDPNAPKGRRKFPLIQNVLRPGQELLVQIVKEPGGTKGAFLTTYLSLPGRGLVLTPGREQVGVSRKVEDENERERLKKIIGSLTPGPGVGVIVRTASVGQNKTTLSKDLQFLKRLWRDIHKKGTSMHPPSLIYQEPDLATRALRDYLSSEIGEIWVDDEETAEKVNQFYQLLFPRQKGLVKLHKESKSSMWEHFGLQKQIDEIHSRTVELPSGGQLVFDQTEALLAIDINSGRISGKTNFQDMALRTNLEAATEIGRQLKLRDLGGQVVIDFIEMKSPTHVRELEKTMKNAMRGDRARHDLGKLSRFGLMQLVRQRLGSSALSVSTEPCPHCKGTGLRRNMEFRAMQALKEIGALAQKDSGNKSSQPQLDYHCPQDLCLYLLNEKRNVLIQIEEQYGKTIRILQESKQC